ncbi:MAG: class I SAM-dependent methyltransferase [Nitrospirae bacterium]|nr:class I SAM-dependent methyltransferase [Nitrospirota bacterium]
MGFYADHVFPYLMDWTMGTRRFRELRQQSLAAAKGSVLEIGFGTGLNLPHYPATVTDLTVIDPAVLLPKKVLTRLAATSIPIHVTHVNAERLPFENCLFDCVVSTWTLCTIPNAVAALREVRRVLKPDGAYLFLEHGRSDDAGVAAWQDRLNPLQQKLGCGCNLNRPIDALVRKAGLHVHHLERFVFSGVPRIVGEMYRGTATAARAESA